MKKITPSDYNFDKVHLIGNGPSADLFDHSDGLVISCHVPLVKSDMVVSNRPIYYGYFGIPIILTSSVSVTDLYAKTVFNTENRSTIYKNCGIVEWTQFSIDQDVKTPWTCGHRAYLWIQHQKPKEVHLWGFDLIWNSQEYEHKDSFQEILAKRNFEKPENKINAKQQALKEASVRSNFWHQILQKNTEVHK